MTAYRARYPGYSTAVRQRSRPEQPPADGQTGAAESPASPPRQG
jgi:hypothetical protein